MKTHANFSFALSIPEIQHNRPSLIVCKLTNQLELGQKYINPSVHTITKIGTIIGIKPVHIYNNLYLLLNYMFIILFSFYYFYIQLIFLQKKKKTYNL